MNTRHDKPSDEFGAAYHDLAMRTAAGPEVFHLPPEPVIGALDYPTRDIGGVEVNRYELNEMFVNDIRSYLIAAARLDNWKSILFYDRPKYRHDNALGGPGIKYRPLYGDVDPAKLSLEHILDPRLIHAILGIATEGAELVEDLAKLMTGDEGVTYDNIARETGDVDWYQELLAEVIGLPVEATREANIARLAKRFPDKFNEADAIARADEENN